MTTKLQIKRYFAYTHTLCFIPGITNELYERYRSHVTPSAKGIEFTISNKTNKNKIKEAMTENAVMNGF